MGMGVAPCHGYVLEATKENMAKFGWDEAMLIQQALDNGAGLEDIKDFDDAMDFLASDFSVIGLKIGYEDVNAEIIRYDRENGDRYDDLEDGYYLSFDEEDLYTRTVTPLGEALKSNKLFPEEKQWTNFG